MKFFAASLVLFGLFVANEACVSRRKNPKIIPRPKTSTTEKPEAIANPGRPDSVHQFGKRPAVVESNQPRITCDSVDGQCRSNCEENEHVKGRFSCPYPTNCCVRSQRRNKPVTPTEAVKTTQEAVEEVATSEIPTEKSGQENPMPEAEGTSPDENTQAATTERPEIPKSNYPHTEAIIATNEPQTRPPSIHKFRKSSAVVAGKPDRRTCAQVDGQCLGKDKCGGSDTGYYIKGRFQCPFPTNCCIPR